MTETGPRHPSPVDRVTDVVGSVKAYALQETVGPMKGAGRWLAHGLIAAVFLGLGVLLLGLGVLRMLQDVTGTALAGGWSFVPYLVAAAVDGAAVWLAVSRINRPTLSKE